MNIRMLFPLLAAIAIIFTGITLVSQQNNDSEIIIYMENRHYAPWQHQVLIDLRAYINTVEHINQTDSYYPPSFTIRNYQEAMSITAEPAIKPSPMVDLRLSILFRESDSADALDSLIRYAMGQCNDIQPSPVLAPHTVALMQVNCAILNHDYTRAISIYGALGLSPTPTLNFNIAWVYLQNGQPESAFTIMDRTIANAESLERIHALAHRAQLHALNFDYDSAIDDMDSAIALAPDNPDLYVLRGQMVLLLYEWDRVENNYNTALAIDPAYAPAYYFRGILHYSLLERESALADFEQYLLLAPEGKYATEAIENATSIHTELDALTD